MGCGNTSALVIRFMRLNVFQTLPLFSGAGVEGKGDGSDVSMAISKEKWRIRLLNARDSALLGVLEYCKEVYEFQLSCDTVRGGSSFSHDCHEWLGLSWDGSIL